MLWSLVAPFFFVPLYYFAFDSVLNFGWFVAGVYLGVGLLIADALWLSRYYADRWPCPSNQLVTRSLLFILAYFPLAIYIITSSASIVGMGMILGIGLVLAIELFRVVRTGRDINLTIGTGKTGLSPREGRVLALAWIVFFAALSIFTWL